MTDKIKKYIKENPELETPVLIVDVDKVKYNYFKLKYFMPEFDVFYAVKSNPGKPIIERLVEVGSHFDVASIPELDLVLECNAKPEKISFGNTIKKEKDIKYAYEKGVRLFVFDSIAELEKLSRSAPGSKVFCRILLPSTLDETAGWGLSNKFGCCEDMAIDLIIKAKQLGLEPYGISWHPGSHQTDPTAWDVGITKTAEIFRQVYREAKIELKMMNMGGGFVGIGYREPVPSMENYTNVIYESLERNFPEGNYPRIIIEPGRSIGADGGIILTEVVLISKKVDSEFEPRWVYLEVGKFNGLPESDCINYVFVTPKDGDETGPVIMANRNCDSQDVINFKTEYHLPLSLEIGDKIQILSTNSYTASYASVNFNGFKPLDVIFI